MKRLFTTCILFIGAISFAYSQYTVTNFINAGQNPGGLNQDAEQPGEAGWTTILNAGSTAWTPVQTIPFPFDFNGNPVSSYKVSSSGVLTFSTSTTTVPTTANVALPSPLIPDNSICIWGITNSGTNDVIRTKTFGTAPNRQHWIFFASFSSPQSSGANWTYWGIVLEEGCNNIYIVDMRTYLTPLALTLGIQIDTATATQVMGSPAVVSNATNGGSVSDPSDNSYYEFVYGVQQTNEVQLVDVNIPSLATNGMATNITGTILNKGTAPLTSVTVSWTDGGMVNNDNITGINVASGATYSFTHATQWTPSNPGNYSNIDVWTSAPNAAADPITCNDTLRGNGVFVNNGTPAMTKKVLLEEFTTAPCQFCPDGAVVVENIRASSPNVIATGIHAGFGTDAMTISEHSTYANRFTSGAPTAMVDRFLFPGESNVGHSRGAWAANTNTRLAADVPVDVNLVGSYNETTRQINVNININFTDYPEPGDLRMTFMIIEDSVTGTGSGYDQVNFYNTQAGHPYFGAGNPIVGYPHRHVLRAVVPSVWGDANLIGANPGPGSNYTQNYNFALSNNYDADQVSLVAAVSYFDATDNSKVFVLNANEVKLTDIITGIERQEANINSLSIYPNPFKEMTNVKIGLDEPHQVVISMYDMMGKLVQEEDRGRLGAGEHLIQLDGTALDAGFYFVRIAVDGNMITRKVSITK